MNETVTKPNRESVHLDVSNRCNSERIIFWIPIIRSDRREGRPIAEDSFACL